MGLLVYLPHIINKPGFGPECIRREAIYGSGMLIENAGYDAVALRPRSTFYRFQDIGAAFARYRAKSIFCFWRHTNSERRVRLRAPVITVAAMVVRRVMTST
jgi:hypothetical protein